MLLSISFMLGAQEPDSSSALFNLREAERNFARASASFGRKEAFQEYLAKGSIIFTDKWITNGKEFWQNRKAAPSILKWEPEFMDISESLDFGISTGSMGSSGIPSLYQASRKWLLPLCLGKAEGSLESHPRCRHCHSTRSDPCAYIFFPFR